MQDEAKESLTSEQKAREESSVTEREKCLAEQRAIA